MPAGFWGNAAGKWISTINWGGRKYSDYRFCDVELSVPYFTCSNVMIVLFRMKSRSNVKSGTLAEESYKR